MWTAWYVKAHIIWAIPAICGQWIGCYLNDNTNDIYVQAKLSNVLTGNVVAHEVAHYCGYSNEDDAVEFHRWANGEKSKRFLEFMETLNKCAKKKI